MSYIYKITNLVNNKIYIGKTDRTIEERFKEHIRNSTDPAMEQPLYRAIRKHGIDKFKIEEIEQCNQETCSDREIYWINELKSFGKNGYNATLGGEGASLYDYEEIADDFIRSGLSIRKYAMKHNMSRNTIKNILIATNRFEEHLKNDKIKKSIFFDSPNAVIKLDKNTGEFIEQYDSTKAALLSVGKTSDKGMIKAVCLGKRNSAYGYKWKYVA